MNPTITFANQINSVSRSCFLSYAPNSFHSHFAGLSQCTLTHAMICTEVGFGNAAYIGLSSSKTLVLQYILNAAANLVGGAPKFALISGFAKGLLHRLH